MTKELVLNKKEGKYFIALKSSPDIELVGFCEHKISGNDIYEKIYKDKTEEDIAIKLETALTDADDKIIFDHLVDLFDSIDKEVNKKES